MNDLANNNQADNPVDSFEEELSIVVETEEADSEQESGALLPYSFAKKHNVLVEIQDDGSAKVLCVDTPKLLVLSELKRRLNTRLVLSKLSNSDFDDLLRATFGGDVRDLLGRARVCTLDVCAASCHCGRRKAVRDHGELAGCCVPFACHEAGCGVCRHPVCAVVQANEVVSKFATRLGKRLQRLPIATGSAPGLHAGMVRCKQYSQRVRLLHVLAQTHHCNCQISLVKPIKS